MSGPWWQGIPAAAAMVACHGRQHELRWAAGKLLAPRHPDLEGEQILSALAGQRYGCLDVLDAWAGHADDLRVLVLASRGPADPLMIRTEDAPTARRRAARAAMLGRQISRDHDDPLATLLSLGGPMQARLTATVAAAWRDRLRDGAEPADAAAADAARPALHAALYGRAVAALRAWTGQPDLRVALTMIPEAARPALARDGDWVAAQLPFGWISDVGPGPVHRLGPFQPGRRAGRRGVGAACRGPRPGAARPGHDQHAPARLTKSRLTQARLTWPGPADRIPADPGPTDMARLTQARLTWPG